jgi:Ran GTPase-activating protein (RanGAP) involved in mRNA processing and transport
MDNCIAMTPLLLLLVAKNQKNGEFDFSNIVISASLISTIVKMLTKSINTLTFKNKKLKSGDIQELSFALRSNPNIAIKTLNLMCNYFGNSGAMDIADILEINNTIVTLVLYMNDIGDKGAIGLASALSINISLTTLDLSYNNIGDLGAIALAKMLHTNTTLTKLYLAANNISDDGAAALGEALTENTTLCELALNNNKITNEGAIILGKALKKNATILSFNVKVNHIDEIGAQALFDSLSYNNICCLSVNDKFSLNYDNSNILKRHNKEYRNAMWTGKNHLSFGKTCHNMIVSTLLCNSIAFQKLPMDVWFYILSFMNRQNFPYKKYDSKDKNYEYKEISDDADVKKFLF